MIEPTPTENSDLEDDVYLASPYDDNEEEVDTDDGQDAG